MASLFEIRNSDFYKSADAATQRKIEENYAKDNPPSATDRLVGQAENLAADVNNITSVNSDTPDAVTQWANEKFGDKPVNRPAYPFAQVDKTTTQENQPQIVHSANIQRDIPLDTPQNIRTGVASQGGLVNGVSWDDIANSPTYQNADADTKYKIRNNFVNQGGEALEKNAGVARQIINAPLGAVGGTVSLLGRVSGGAQQIGLNYSANTLKGILSTVGMTEAAKQIDTAQKDANTYLQNSMNQLDYLAARTENQLGISTTTGGRLGHEIGPGLAEGALLTVSEGAAAPILFGTETSRAYGSQDLDKKDIVSAVTQAGIQVAANEFAGGGIGRGIRAPITTDIEKVASRPVQDILGMTAPKVGVVESTAKNMGAAYAGTYTTALAQGKTPEEAQQEAIHATTVAGGLSLGTHGVGIVKNTASRISSNEGVSQPVRARIEEQAETINNAKTTQERRSAIDDSPEFTVHAAADDLAKRNQNLFNMGGKGPEGYADVTGTRGQKASKVETKDVQQNIKDTEADILREHKDAVADNDTLFTDMKKQVEGDITSTGSKASDSIRDELISKTTKWQNELKKGPGAYNPKLVKNMADEITDLHQQLNEVAPHEAEHFADNYTSPVTGRKGDINFQHDAALHVQRRNILQSGKAFVNAQKAVTPNAFKKFMGRILMHHVVNKVGGAWANAGLHAADLGIQKLGGMRRAANFERESANINEQLKRNAPSAEVEPTVKSSGAFAEGNARAQARREQNLNNAVKDAKAKFAGHQDLQDQITTKNVNDEAFISGLNSELVQRNLKARTEAKKAQSEQAQKEQDAQHKKDINEYKKDYPQYSGFFEEAHANLKQKGQKETLANFGREVNRIVSSTEKEIAANRRKTVKASEIEARNKARDTERQRKAEQKAKAAADKAEVAEAKAKIAEENAAKKEASDAERKASKAEAERLRNEAKAERQKEKEAKIEQAKLAESKEADNISDFQKANPHLDKFFGQAERNVKQSGKKPTLAAFEKEVNALVEGRKAMASGERVKTPFKAGSKEETFEDIRKGFATDDIKNEQRSAVESYYRTYADKSGKLKPEQQEKLHNTLADIANKHFKKEDLTSEMKNTNEYWQGKTERNTRNAKKEILFTRSETLDNTISDALKNSGLSERQTNKFIKEKTDQLNKSEMNSTEFDSFISKVKDEANELAKEGVSTSSKRTKAATEENEGVTLSDKDLNNLRDKYHDSLADAVGTKEFDKRLDEFETFLEDHDLTDSATSKKSPRFIETLTRIHERKLRGVTDPQALINISDWNAATGQGVELGNLVRKAIGTGKKFEFLTEPERAAHEAENTPAKKAERARAAEAEASAKLDEAIRTKNREAREARKVKLAGKKANLRTK